MSRQVKRRAGLPVATVADAALHIDFPGMVAAWRQARTGATIVRLSQAPGRSMVARNASTVSGRATSDRTGF